MRQADVNWATAFRLAVGEGRRLVRHPAFLVGVLLAQLTLWLATRQAAFDWQAQHQLALGLAPLGWAAIVAGNLTSLRTRRDSTEELFGTTPTSDASRTTSHLLAALATVPVSAAIVAVWWVLLVARGVRGVPDWAEVAVGPAIVLGGCVAGVFTARWLRVVPAAFAAVVFVVVVQDNMLSLERAPARWLAFLVPPSHITDPGVQIRHAGWHLAYLLAAALLLGSLALARHGWSRPVTGGVAVGLVVVLGAAFVQTRPPTRAETARIVSRLVEPDGQQHCREEAGIRYCAYHAFESLVPEWQEVVEAVVGHVPAPHRRAGLVVRQRPEASASDMDCQPVPFLRALPVEVEREIDPTALWRADGEVHPGLKWPDAFPCEGPPAHGVFLGVQTGAWAVGLPPAVGPGPRRCAADGQARSAIALWLGTRSAAEGPAVLRRVALDARVWENDRITFPALDGMGWDVAPPWGVAWHRSDVDAALALAAIPEREVLRVLERDWARLTAPETTTAALLDALGASSRSRPVPAETLTPCP